MADCDKLINEDQLCEGIDPIHLTLDGLMPVEELVVNGMTPEEAYRQNKYKELRRLVNIIETGIEEGDRLLTKIIYNPNDIMVSYTDKDGNVVERKTLGHIQQYLIESPTYKSKYTIHQIGSNNEKQMTYSNGLAKPTVITVHKEILRYVTPNQLHNSDNTTKLVDNFRTLLNRAHCIYYSGFCKGYMKYLSDIQVRNQRLIHYRIMLLHKLLQVVIYFNNQIISLANAKRTHYEEVYNNPNKGSNTPLYYVNYGEKNMIPEEVRARNVNRDIKMVSPEEATRLIPDEGVSNHFVGIMKEGFANMNYNYDNVDEAPITFSNVDKAKLIEQQDLNVDILARNKELKEDLNEVRGKIEAIRKLNRGTYIRLLASYLFIAIVVCILLYVMLRT